MAAQATQALPQAKHCWVSKLAAKFLPYGMNMAQWKLQTQTQCLRCACPKEDKDHIFRCPEELAVALWTKALEELDNWMAANKTHPQIRQEIVAGLQPWHNEDTDTQPPQEQSSAVILQDQIGWGVALEGCLVWQWREEQDNYWKAFKSWKSSWRWTMALLTQLMMTAWDMWQHHNKVLHEMEKNKQEIVEANINQQIWQAYKPTIHTVPKAVRPLMRWPLVQLAFPATYKCQWMATLQVIQTQVQHLAGSSLQPSCGRRKCSLVSCYVNT